MHQWIKPEANKGVLVIYTGGTIGSRPFHTGDPGSHRVVVPWEVLQDAVPELGVLEKQGCHIRCVPLEPLMDSCNMGPDHWRRMAEIIARYYPDYDGFVVLHGTDTMAYSASMLSFMLRNLGKPVVFTGAQRSALVDVRNDAVQNLISAILVANHRFSRIPVIPEVVICFGNRILRGNRTLKNDTSGYSAYDSPNLEAIGEIGDQIIINERLLRRPPADTRPFHIQTHLDTRVMPIFIYPGISPEQIRSQLAMPGLRAVVVQSFGTGNIPSAPGFVDVFREAAESRGVILTIVSQCRRGPVQLGLYESSAGLLDAGFIAGDDITVVAAVCKLMWLLGDPNADRDDVRMDFQRSIAGEMSASRHVTPLLETAGAVSCPEKTGIPGTIRFPRKPLNGQWDNRRIDTISLLMRGCILSTPDGKPADISFFLDLDPRETPAADPSGALSRFQKCPREMPGILAFDLTDALIPLAEPGARQSLTLVLHTPGATLSWAAAEIVIMVRERGV